MTGDEEKDAADHFRRPDQPVLLCRGEIADQRRQQADTEEESADEEDEGARPLEPPRFERPPAPPALTPVRGQQDRAVAAGREEDAAGEKDPADQQRPTDVSLSQQRPHTEQRATNHKRGRGNRVGPLQPPLSHHTATLCRSADYVSPAGGAVG